MRQNVALKSDTLYYYRMINEQYIKWSDVRVRDIKCLNFEQAHLT